MRLTEVNYLNSNLNPNLTDVAAPTPRIYLDVDEDQFASPLDVILVINYLNRNSNSEGEGISKEPFTKAVDGAFLGSEEIEFWKRRCRAF